MNQNRMHQYKKGFCVCKALVRLNCFSRVRATFLSFLALTLMTHINVFSQSELMLPIFQDVFQSSYLSPTVRPEHAVSIGLPGISSVYTQVINNGFVPSAVAKKGIDTIFLSTEKILDNLRDVNLLNLSADIDIFHLRLRIYNWTCWLGVRQRHSLSFYYPKDLFDFTLRGNKHLVGKTIDFSGLGLNANLHREYSFGISTELNKWTIGGRISLLQGLSSLYLKPKMIKATIDEEDFDHNFEMDAILYSAGVPFTEDQMLNTDVFSDTDWLIGYMSRFRNPGASLAFGLSYKLNQKTSISFSFSDVGLIYWNDSTINYRAKGLTTFNGLDGLTSWLNGGELDIDTALNTFRKNLTGEEFEGSFTTWLHPKFYLSTNYQLSNRTYVGAQLYATINRRIYPALAVGISQGFGRYLNFALTASMNQRTFTNLGFGMLIKPGPLQIYLGLDNFYSPLIDPLTFTNMNFRFGINLVFGRVKTPQGLPYR